MKKKILSIVPAPLLPAVSGGQKATYLRLNELAKTNDIVVITDTNSPTTGHHFTLKPLIKHNKTKYFSLKNYKIIKEQIKLEQPDIVLLEQTFMGLIIFLVCRNNNIPYAVYNHNIEYLRFKSLNKIWWPLMFYLEKFTYKYAKSLFFITDHDRQKAIKHLKADNKKCSVATYGVNQLEPILANKQQVEEVKNRHHIKEQEKVFKFFGVMSYLPNLQALDIILKEINPILEKQCHYDYKILICGGGLPKEYNKLKDFKNIIYAGFVPDIDEYIQISDVVLNPVQTGGGIKTKVIEALGFNKNVVSTQTGAIGITEKYCSPKLKIVPDNNWQLFSEKIIEIADNNDLITPSFFSVYTWKAISEVINQSL